MAKARLATTAPTTSEGGFTGFLDQGKFWKALAKNQNREWFQAHKTEFEDGWNRPMKALLHDVSAKIDSAYEHCDLDPPKVFRIFRDVRFSRDKTPYKTHLAGMIPVRRNANVMETPIALYFHVGQETTVASAEAKGPWRVVSRATEGASHLREADELARRSREEGSAAGRVARLRHGLTRWTAAHVRA